MQSLFSLAFLRPRETSGLLVVNVPSPCPETCGFQVMRISSGTPSFVIGRRRQKKHSYNCCKSDIVEFRLFIAANSDSSIREELRLLLRTTTSSLCPSQFHSDLRKGVMNDLFAHLVWNNPVLLQATPFGNNFFQNFSIGDILSFAEA